MDEATRQLVLTSTVIGAAIGGILALVGAGMTAWFAKDREERSQRWTLHMEQLQARREWNVERVRHTRQFLWAYADLLAFGATQDAKEYVQQRRIFDKARDLAGTDALLFGDDVASLAFAEVAGKISDLDPGVPDLALAEQVLQAANDLDSILTRQMDRAMSDEPLLLLSATVAKTVSMMSVPDTPRTTKEGQLKAHSLHLPAESATRPTPTLVEPEAEPMQVHRPQHLPR